MGVPGPGPGRHLGRRLPGGAALLEQAATTATTHGLAAARDTLLSGRDRLPGGHIGRERLVGMVRWWRDHHTAATGPAGLAAVPAGRPQDEGEIVTLLHVPAPVQAERAPEQPETADVRFGPGVPSMSTAEQIWRSGREQATVYGQEHHRESRLATRRRRRTAVAAATLALIVAGALLAWLLRDPGPVLAVEKVDVKAPRRTQGCDSTVVINGVITTNGGDGRVRYEWRRSDSKKPIVQEETVTADTTSYQVSLRWTVKGEGSFKATATLRILDPEPAGKPMEDRATFTYRCR
ncbi:hypothetical protein [Thermocatellispora tengchongensis]|uniref:hypothetical protein n=1 Tax=Thermocatellispora tengchongensis TaxID=1073253 RepID=UPI003632015F